MRSLRRLASPLLVVLAFATEARAYDYHEHRAITTRALRHVLASDSPDTPGSLTEALATLHARLRAERTVETVRICEHRHDFLVDTVDPRQQRSGLDHPCFDAADLPALAGDHSSGPTALVERWLLRDANPLPQGLENFFSGALHATEVDRAPTVCEDVPAHSDANPRRLLELVRQPGGPSPTSLLGADEAFLCLAAHNAHHFRLTRVGPLPAAELPLESASSAYAWFHLRGIAYAQVARTATDPAKQQALRAYAVLLELYALHFLQDMMAGGHVASNRMELNPSSVGVTHNDHNFDGVQVGIGAALRNHLQALGPGFALPPTVRSFTAFGDAQLTSVLDRDDCSTFNAVTDVEGLNRCRTMSVTTALTIASLEEFRATLAEDTPNLEPCREELRGCVEATTGTPTFGWLGNVARCEGARRIEPTSCGTTRFVSGAVDHDLLKALAMMPELIEWPVTLNAAGLGGVLRFTGRAEDSFGWGRHGHRAAVVIGIGRYALLPPAIGRNTAEGITQPFVGGDLSLRGEMCLNDCPTEPYARRVASATVSLGIARTNVSFAAVGGVDLALRLPLQGVESFRAGLQVGFDFMHRLSTRDTFGAAWTFAARYGSILGEDDQYVSLGVGFVIELPAPRPLTYAYSPRREAVHPLWPGRRNGVPPLRRDARELVHYFERMY